MGGTSLGSRRPRSPFRRQSASRSLDQRFSDTVTASPSGTGAASSRCRQGSATKRPSLMSGIERLLERRVADAAIGVGKALAAAPFVEIDIDELVDRAGHGVGGHRGTDDGAQRGVLVGAAADGDLIELLAVLIDPQNADMADMMVAAGVDAAGNLDAELADLMVALGEMLAQLLRHGKGARVGEAAIIEAGAGDDVAGESGIGMAEIGGLELAPDFRQIAAAKMRQHQVLLVRHANLAQAKALGEIGEELHLLGRDIARRLAGRLQRDGGDGVA